MIAVKTSATTTTAITIATAFVPPVASAGRGAPFVGLPQLGHGLYDTAAVEALAVVAEACVAWELARAAREKFGGDALGDFVAAHRAYLERIDWQPRTR